MTWQDMQKEIEAGRAAKAYLSSDVHHCASSESNRAYSPLAFGLPELHDHSVMADLCTRTDKTSQQILIQWGLQRGTSVIPKSVSPERITANYEALGWELTAEDHALLSSIEGRCRVYPDDWLPAQVFWEEDD
ncbi:hypothetical protein QQS21_006473 [Conoideocrella luteorostrata]|uniref:NADP-dependent oxidoreductase domain-containing protein n=1 Tax=Conoideocrella luteorostrata TaxID=1105319 RepID=A0AAJ0FY92_9HYPO|nr:hypothetical protein QQS21_006473 [Conoideocrella luteorostrata]